MADSQIKTSIPRRFAIFAVVFSSLLLARMRVAPAEDHTFGFAAGADEEGIPRPWKVLGHPAAGQPAFRVKEDTKYGKVLELHAKGDQSDGIYRAAGINLSETPMIHFSWKVQIHPDGQVGTAKDDAAVQVHLDFGRRGLRRQVLSYIFDPQAKPGGCYDDSSFVAINRAIVLNSGQEKVGEWLSHSRNVARDFRACYGTDPPRVQNISVFCDSNDSNTESLGYCTEITFTKLAEAE